MFMPEWDFVVFDGGIWNSCDTQWKLTARGGIEGQLGLAKAMAGQLEEADLINISLAFGQGLVISLARLDF